MPRLDRATPLDNVTSVMALSLAKSSGTISAGPLTLAGA
jgi:hypothetical protein